ncbi:unnamed protein product [Prorocentrum cordatum]|uniref:RNase H type-1 domain-containing protein n=1 Tax=Prorocentrum cordatum TaxID=2364126 RepID=A0ABN9VAW9_9DINO|nr:unnamed protein product [Polarella glacialis]
MQKGDKCLFKYLKAFRGKASVGLKLDAYMSMPRASALYLSPIVHWTSAALWDAIRWERSTLKRVFRLRPKPGEGRQAYLHRTARKIDHWMDVKRKKPIHVCMIERMCVFMWRENTTATILGRIRTDRDRRWWDAIKDVPREWRRHLGFSAHSHRGRQKNQDAVFFAAWDPGWRDRFNIFRTHEEYMAAKDSFVHDACASLGLPQVARGTPVEAIGEDLATQPAKCHQVWDPAHLALLVSLCRDELRDLGAERMQLEFVVDNLTLAEIGNGVTRNTNNRYRNTLDCLRLRLKTLYSSVFEYKAKYLDPIDWRTREHNQAADHIAHCVLAGRADVDTLSCKDVAGHLNGAVALQLFSDGGYVHGMGAAAFVVVGVFQCDAGFRSKIIGARGRYFPESHSAFHMEAEALGMATKFMIDLAEKMARPPKRARAM